MTCWTAKWNDVNRSTISWCDGHFLWTGIVSTRSEPFIEGKHWILYLQCGRRSTTNMGSMHGQLHIIILYLEEAGDWITNDGMIPSCFLFCRWWRANHQVTTHNLSPGDAPMEHSWLSLHSPWNLRSFVTNPKSKCKHIWSFCDAWLITSMKLVPFEIVLIMSLAWYVFHRYKYCTLIIGRLTHLGWHI